MIQYFYTLQNNQLSFVTIQRYYIVIDCIPYAVRFIPMIHLFCTCKFVSLNFPHPPTPFSSGNHLFFLCICDSVPVLLYLFICFVFYITCKWNHNDICLSLSDFISLSIILSTSIHVTNGKIFFFSYGTVIFLCVCVCVCVCVCIIPSLSIHLLMDTEVASMSWLLWIMLQWT